MREQAHFPLTFTDDMRPIGQATINGTTVPAMLSSGAAESVVLNQKVLERLGVPMRSSTGFMNASDERNPTGFDIVRKLTHASVKDLSIGPLKTKGGTYPVEEFMDDTYGIRVGAGTLLQSDLEIALDAGYLKSFKPDGCFRAHLAYWNPQATVVSALVDPWQRDLRIIFKVGVNGKSTWALLSTATPHSYMPRLAAERLGLSANSPGAIREEPLPGHAADKPVWKIPLPSLSIGALEIKDLDLRLADLPYEGEIMVLGTDFLQRHRVYIAMSQKQIYFSPIRTPRVLKRGAVDVIPQRAQ